MRELYISLIRTVLLYSVVILAVRIMGKRQIKEMQPSELVVTLMISNIAAMPMQEVGISIFAAVIPIVALVILEVGMSTVMLKSRRFRQLIAGMPVVVIEKGSVNQNAMRSLRLSNEDLFEELRKKDVFDITAVEYAIIETDGTMSVLLKSGELPATAAQVKADDGKSGLNVLIISDGSVDKQSASLAGWTTQKIALALNEEKVSIDDVFIMSGNADGDFNIIRKAMA